jgi:drug/metabolite transporter (DMT)-like permease
MTPASPAPARTSFPYGLFALLMAMDVGALLIEKVASTRSDGAGWALARSYLLQPWVWITVAIKLGQLFAWSAILARVAISRAFPLTAIASPLTIIAATLIFHETPTWQVWVGSAIIMVGVILLGPDKSDAPAHGT